MTQLLSYSITQFLSDPYLFPYIDSILYIYKYIYIYNIIYILTIYNQVRDVYGQNKTE